jgi:hypothetical protein
VTVLGVWASRLYAEEGRRRSQPSTRRKHLRNLMACISGVRMTLRVFHEFRISRNLGSSPPGAGSTSFFH